MSSAATSRHQVSLRLPESWVILDLDPATALASIRIRAERAFPGDGNAASRARLEAFLRLTTARAQDIGFHSVAGYFATLDEAPWSLIASAAVVVLDSPISLTSDELAEGLTGQGRGGSEVELELGPALRRVNRTRTLVPDTDEEIEVVSVQYVASVPQGVAILQFSTPNLTLEREFVDLFDAIAATAKLVE